MQPHETLLGWIEEPDAAHGIRFADPAGGWRFWPYSRLATLARTAAAALVPRVPRGAVVMIVLPSSAEFAGMLFGAMLAGAAPSPVSPPAAFQDRDAYRRHLAGLLRSARPALLVTEPALKETLTAMAGDVPVTTVEELTACAGSGPPPVAGGPPDAGDLALLQFTSGSSGPAGAVEVPYSALAANVQAIRSWLGMGGDDVTASWLPVHHDMGLIGCLLTPVAGGGDLWLMRPEDFVRDPLRFLRCFGAENPEDPGAGASGSKRPGKATLTAIPNFGLGYVVRRVPPGKLSGLDFSGWRTIIVGAERVDDAALEAFCALLGPYGLDRGAMRPAYGLAEATLAVTGLPRGQKWTTLRVRPDDLRLGGHVGAAGDGDGGAYGQTITGCGTPLPGVRVSIRDEEGREVGENTVGEIVVHGPSVAGGHESGGLRTADAGFLHGGQLYVIGRLGDCLKLRGRALFAEDLELALHQSGIPPLRVAALLGHRGGVPTVVAMFERPDPDWLRLAGPLLRRRTEGARLVIVGAPRGAIARTSSGKPKRRQLWRQFTEDRLPGTVITGGTV